MSAPADKPNPFDAFASPRRWRGGAACSMWPRELRDVDAEMMDTLLDTYASGGMTLDGDAAAKVRSLATLMRELHLEPEALRRQHPRSCRSLRRLALAVPSGPAARASSGADGSRYLYGVLPERRPPQPAVRGLRSRSLEG